MEQPALKWRRLGLLAPDIILNHFSGIDQSCQQTAIGEKKRRLDHGPEGQRYLDRRQQVAVPDLECRGKGPSIESESSVNLRGHLPNSAKDSPTWTESESGGEICNSSSLESGLAPGRCSSHSLEAGPEPTRPGGLGASHQEMD